MLHSRCLWIVVPVLAALSVAAEPALAGSGFDPGPLAQARQAPAITERIGAILERIGAALRDAGELRDPRPLLREAAREAGGLDPLLAEAGRRIAEAGPEAQRRGGAEAVEQARGAVTELRAALDQTIGDVEAHGRLENLQIQALLSIYSQCESVTMAVSKRLKQYCPTCNWKG